MNHIATKMLFRILFGCLLLPVHGYAQMNGPVLRQNVVVTPSSPVSEADAPEDSIVITSVVIESESSFDTAVFDSTWRVPFKIYENRGDEMIHSWICVGAPRAPHLYLGGGIYHFDKMGLSDVQFGWYPASHPKTWEVYFSAERMFFFRKKSKEVEVPMGIDVDYHNGRPVKYLYNAKLRRDKFYGITGGVSYEGLMNPRKKPLYVYSGEDNVYQVMKSYTLSVKAGIGRMRCKNVEYAAPFKRKGRLRASSMSRWQVGAIYFPVQKYETRLIAGNLENVVAPFLQEKLAGYISWEGRVALMSMKREWGFCANLTFVAPSWNRQTDHRLALNATWGLYFSLDKKNPRWARNNAL